MWICFLISHFSNQEFLICVIRLSAVLVCFEVHHVRPASAAPADRAMSVLPRRLAGLWPWLLMAGLHLVLGQPGLGQPESERPLLPALITVTLLRQDKSITLEGLFVGGSVGNAEGKLMQACLDRSFSALQAAPLFHFKILSPSVVG
ncbi:hypothetical protein WMY93_007981 [Mugilogobius chulae]|uniref:Uncharacterized protein n=1 Tax=Mugilogobius chulae TaxID=88201 RepID=A0AAW0PFT9_9GOBI